MRPLLNQIKQVITVLILINGNIFNKVVYSWLPLFKNSKFGFCKNKVFWHIETPSKEGVNWCC